jgi:hypothetical protein
MAAAAPLDDLTRLNYIQLSVETLGPVPADVPRYSDADGAPGYGISSTCTQMDQSPGGAPPIPVGVSGFGESLVFAGRTSIPGVPVGTPTDRDNGFVRCVLSEDAATRDSILTPPTFQTIDAGSSRAADPLTDAITSHTDGVAMTVDIPYTRTSAVVQVTITNTYAPVPLVVVPSLTG